MTTEAAALRHFLQAQRDSVVAIVDGLDDDLASTVVVPSGWSPLDLVEHLSGAEHHWFAVVMAGGGELASGNQQGRTLRTVVEAYAERCAASDRVIDSRGLDDPVSAGVPANLVDDVRDLRGVLLHLIEETARHAGHLDIVRELIDGRVGLGPR